MDKRATILPEKKVGIIRAQVEIAMTIPIIAAFPVTALTTMGNSVKSMARPIIEKNCANR
jgi:hypothetical protein